MSCHRYPTTRSQLRAELDAERKRRVVAEAAEKRALGRAFVADQRADDADLRAATAEAEYMRLAGHPMWADETTAPLHVPAGRDAHAAAGFCDPLTDTDPAWPARHETAAERTQPMPVTSSTALHDTHGPVIRVGPYRHPNPASAA